MFLQWVAKCELVPVAADSYVLKNFSDKCQRGMCSMVVGFLSADKVDFAQTLPSGHHIRWSMEVIGHSFALGMEDADVIFGALRIYEQWLGVDPNKSPKETRPACMANVEQSFIQDMLGQMTLVFEDRTSDNSRTPEASQLVKQVSIGTKVLDIFDAVAKRRGSQLSSQTWDRMIRLLLGTADGVLHGTRGVLGNHLCAQLVRILLEIYLRSLVHCGPRGEIWNLLQKFCRRWIHRIVVIEQWNAVTLALTKSLMRRIHNTDTSKEVEISWADIRVQTKLELESPLLAYAWYRLMRVIGHPSGIQDPEAHFTVIKGISRLADELTRLEQVPRTQYEHVLGELGSPPSRDNSIFAAVANGNDSDPSHNDDLIKDTTTRAQPRSPPDVNTVLRVLGPWLFDACLTRKPRFAAGRSEAIRCLGKLMCQFSGGRTKRIQWSYGIRSLIALQTALLDDDERINAAAVFNWSQVFGLYGNHTLRGAGVVAGSFHKAIERIFRAGERSNSPKDKSAPRGIDALLPSDDHSIGGIPIVLLRRAAIEACSSLLTLHAHIPRSSIKEAEKEVVLPSMMGIPGLFSSLPKYTSSNVVALLMNAVKIETDPTNQQMIMWILTVAIQQEASFWASGLASSRNSQASVTILLICSFVSKSTRYTPQVMFTAFDCLRHLSLACDDLFLHAVNAVIHMVNSCCDFITSSAPILRSSRAPFYLDSLMASAYHCIIEWIVAAPLLLSKPQVMSKIITTVVDGNDRIQSFASKTTAMAVREAAQQLVTTLMKHHVAQSKSYGTLASRSSPINEKVVLGEFCEQETENVLNSCRFFAVNKNSILTVIEKPVNSIGTGEAILILRDATGRYVWRSKPRHCDGPRPKSLAEFEEYIENGDDNSDTDDADGDLDRSFDDTSDSGSNMDPLLHAIRETQTTSNLMSWRSNTSGADSPGSSDPTKVLSGEGNCGMSSLVERKASAMGNDARDSEDAVFKDLLSLQSSEDERGANTSESKRAFSKLRVKPEQPTKDKALQTWEVSRRMMSELGFLSVRNWGSVFAMDASDDLLHDVNSLDHLPGRETFEIGVAYATSSSSQGGYDRIRVVSGKDVSAGTVTLSPDYERFLSALGERVSLQDHIGFSGCLRSTQVKGSMLYHSQYSHESCFYVPTMPLEPLEEAGSLDMFSLMSRANVLIVWNECQQKYTPGNVLWETTLNLPLPTSRTVFIIDPLGNDLFCVHIVHESSPLFSQRDVITNEEDTCVDEGEVFCARVLGPLQDGMVVNSAWLGPLVRQTAINAAWLSRSFHRYQHEIGAISSAPVGPESNRAKMITSIVEAHMHPQLPGDFYGELFSDLTSKR